MRSGAGHVAEKCWKVQNLELAWERLNALGAGGAGTDREGGAEEAGGRGVRGPCLSPETHPFLSMNRGVCPVARP